MYRLIIRKLEYDVEFGSRPSLAVSRSLSLHDHLAYIATATSVSARTFRTLMRRPKSRHSRFLSYLMGLCLILAGSPAPSETLTITGALEVIDGDTLSIGPAVIRLSGIDAPEKAQRCNLPDGTTWACGRSATRFLVDLIASGDLDCVPQSRGPYGRLISTCTVDGVDIGLAMIEAGLAWAFIRYSNEFVEHEAVARDSGLGVFQAPTETPWDWRDNAWDRAVEASPGGCPIKGNINRGKMIYHTPWSANYSQTDIDEADGERWFCDEATALAAGWTARR